MRLATFPLLALLLAGCAGYHIGPIQPKFMQGAKTIAVPTFRNDTLVPHLEVLVANGIIKQLQQDGTYQVASEDKADVVLDGSITTIRRHPSRSVIGDYWATREFTLSLRLSYKLSRRSTGETLRTGSVTGETSFFVGGDVQQEERQAIPLAVEDAAVRLVSYISEGW